MKDFNFLSRCGGYGIYAVYGACDVGESAQIGNHHTGLFILYRYLLDFKFFELFKLFYNIMCGLFIFPFLKREVFYLI